MSKQYRIRNRIATVTSADGVTGILCRSINGRYFFRIYHSHGEFSDYDLAHADLKVTIHDPDAAFYSFADRQVLDHAPQTLGYEEVTDSGDQ